MKRSIRIDEKIYRRLCEHAGKLQAKKKRPVSIDEAISDLIMKAYPKLNKISDLAGSWDVTNEEIESIMWFLREGWRKWKTTGFV